MSRPTWLLRPAPEHPWMSWTGWNVLAAPVYAGHLPALVALESQREGVSVRCRSLVGITLRTLLETGADDATLCAAMRETLLRWALTPRG